MFEGLKKKRVTTKKKKNYFKLNFEKPTNVGKLYLLLNIHKTFSNLLWHPVILSSVTLTEKLFGILRSSFAASNERRKIFYIKYRWDLGEKTVGETVVTPLVTAIVSLVIFSI